MVISHILHIAVGYPWSRGVVGQLRRDMFMGLSLPVIIFSHGCTSPAHHSISALIYFGAHLSRRLSISALMGRLASAGFWVIGWNY